MVAEVRDELRDFRRATVGSLNALRADMTDLRADMTDLRSEVTDLRSDMTNGFIEMRGKFDAAAAGQQQIVDLIQGVLDDRGENGPD